jgi:hypothetical protein
MKNTFLLLASMLFLSACGSSENEESKQEESIVTDETAPKIEEETTNGDNVVDAEETADDEIPSGSKPGEINQDDPEMVMEGIFLAAKSGNYTGLDGICADNADGDCKSICSIATADAKKKEEFKSYFSTGITTNTELNGSKATVEFKFGPDGKKDEKMELVLVNKKWYIQSF